MNRTALVNRKILRKLFLWTLVLVLVVLTILLILAHALSPWINGAPAQTQRLFAEANLSFEVWQDSCRGRSLRWIRAGNPESKKLLLFFHGAPGSWADFSSYLTDTSLQSFQLVAMDRPGYGQSGYGRVETSIREQARLGACVVDHFPGADSIWVIGYSYGGPVAVSYAAQFSDRVQALLLLAPVVHPEEERIFWFNPILDWSLSRALLPVYVNAATDEKLSHAAALAAMKEDWKGIQAPVVHIHCQDDWIAPFEPNVNWVRQQLPDSLHRLERWQNGGHFLPNPVKQKVLPILLNKL